MAEAARPKLQSGLRIMLMRIPKTGDDAVSMAVNNLRSIANPLRNTCLISNVCEFAVHDGQRLRVGFLSVQRNGINFRISINLVRNLCH